MPTIEETVATIPTTPLLRIDQVEALTEEKNRLSAMIHHPLDSRYSQEKAAAQKTIRTIEKQLANESPAAHAPTKDNDRAALANLERKLRTEIVENMPPQVVMRRNPPGAVDWHRRWEKANKTKILRWKNVRRMLDPTSDDRDIANIERYRPPGHITGALTDAQIQGHMALTAAAKANYDDLDMTDHTSNLSVEVRGQSTIYTPTLGADGSQEIVGPPLPKPEPPRTTCKRDGCNKPLPRPNAQYCGAKCSQLERNIAFRQKRALLKAVKNELAAVAMPAQVATE